MIYKIFNIFAFALMIVLNYLANALPINGKTTGELSAEYPNLFVPTGLTFSIWGIIYLMLFIFIIVQFHESNKLLIQQIGWLFAISCILNSLWIVAWHYQWLSVSLIIMLGLLVSLVVINISLKGQPIGLTKASFGIYLGWICIATIANVTALLVSFEWGGWGMSEQFWAIAMILIGALIAFVTTLRMNNPFVAIAVLWAFLGIILKQKGSFPIIVTVAAVAMAIVAVSSVLAFLRVKATALGS